MQLFDVLIPFVEGYYKKRGCPDKDSLQVIYQDRF
jgi:hypothetical protein